MKHRKSLPSFKTILIVVVTVAYTITLTLLSLSLLGSSNGVHLPGIGTIVAFGYEIHGGDLIAKDDNQALDWGTIYVGGATNRSFYIRSKSSIDVGINLTATKWIFYNAQGQNASSQPDLNPIRVTPDYNGTFTPNQEIYLTLTLEIRSESEFIEYLIGNDIRTFTFDIIIQPSEV